MQTLALSILLARRQSMGGIYGSQFLKNDGKESVDFFGLRKKFPLPTEFLITLTHKCNLTCDMCTQYGGKYKNHQVIDLPAKEWEKFIESVAWIKPKITLFGGEPLIYPEIRNIFEIVNKYNCSTEVITNGYFLENYLEDVAKYKINLTISIDGLKETHNKIRNANNSFKRIIKSLELLKKINQAEKLINWSINFVILPDNVDEIVDFLDFITEFHPNSVSFQHLQFSSPEINQLTNLIWQQRLNTNYTEKLLPKKAYTFDKEFIKKLRKIITEVKQKYTSKVNFQFFPDLSDKDIPLYYSDNEHFLIQPKRICLKPWQNPTLQPNGDVLLCLDHPVGNITQENFWTIWGNEKSDQFRKSLMAIERFPICTRCCNLYQTGAMTHDKKSA